MKGCTEVEPAMITLLLFGAQLSSNNNVREMSRTSYYIQIEGRVNFLCCAFEYDMITNKVPGAS